MKLEDPIIIEDPIMNACVDVVKFRNGEYSISCKIGFWTAYGRDWNRVLNEARHYFGQYLQDGEYDELLKEAGL